jgi:hypothetical protein
MILSGLVFEIVGSILFMCYGGFAFGIIGLLVRLRVTNLYFLLMVLKTIVWFIVCAHSGGEGGWEYIIGYVGAPLYLVDYEFY